MSGRNAAANSDQSSGNAGVVLTPEIKAALNAETDTRFWAQTGVKPGAKLDPQNPIDAKMIPVWQDLYGKMLKAFRAGTIVWTHTEPSVNHALADAKAATKAAATSLSHAAVAKAAAKGHEQDAAQAHAQGKHDEVVVATDKATEKHAEAEQHHEDAKAALDGAKIAAAIAAQHVERVHDEHGVPPHHRPRVDHRHLRHAAHQVLQFVMSGGHGVQVGGPPGVVISDAGENAAAATQAAAAPLAAASADPAGAASLPPDLLPQFPPAIPRLHRESRAGIVAAGVASLLAIGVALYSVSQSHKSQHKRSAFRRSAPPRYLGPGVVA
jgi:hypothetical protein